MVFPASSGVENTCKWIKNKDCNTECGRLAVPGIWSYLEPYKLLLFGRRKLKMAKKADFSFNPDWKKEDQDNEPSISGITTFVFKYDDINHTSSPLFRSYNLPHPLSPSKLHFSYTGKGLCLLLVIRILRYLKL